MRLWGLWGLWGGNNTFARCTRMHCRVAFWGPAKLSGLSRTCKFDFSKDTFQLSAGSDPFWSGLILDWSWSLFSPALQPSKQREVFDMKGKTPPKESQAPEAPSGRAWGRWRGRARSRWWTGSRSCPEVRFLRERNRIQGRYLVYLLLDRLHITVRTTDPIQAISCDETRPGKNCLCRSLLILSNPCLWVTCSIHCATKRGTMTRSLLRTYAAKANN